MSSPRSLVDDYLAERSLYVASSTVANDITHLERFFEFLDKWGVDHVGLISFETLDAYRHSLETLPGKRGKIVSDAFKHAALKVPRFFLNWASCRGLTLVDFSLYPLPHRTANEIFVPTIEQVKMLLEAPNPNCPSGRRDRLVMESFYTLGLRRRESHRLSIGDLNFHQQTVRVLGKRQRERLLPLSSRLCGLINHYLKEMRPRLRPFPDEQALWVSPQNGTRLGFTYLRDIVRRNSSRLGLQIYPHLLRHACATHMLEAGAGLKHIQAFLGHDSPSSTERYAKVTGPELRKEFDRCHPRARS